MIFDGYMIATDLDNTLLDDEHRVSERNRNAIDYFIKNGGLFTAATGRAQIAAAEQLKKFSVNAPVILHNGAKLYDFSRDEVIFEKYIEDKRKEAVRIMHEKYPFLGFEVYCSDEKAYVISECKYTSRLKQRKYPTVYDPDDSLYSKNWIKLLMIADKDILDEFEPVYRRYDNGYSVRSGDNFYDIVSDGVSKGKCLARLAKSLNTNIKNVIAVGDNMNDLSLLEAAGISYAVDNAEAQIKAAANFAAPSNNDDALCYIINDIEKKIRR